ncbi:MAG: bacillithiol biosynthesis deacetylase BshB1 [Gemmatimonadota bacterium]|nr:bacillithiol biosynthesis deacetylase BshB1 [Gemmatimonadota bacterium]MDH3424189.1 bacillithiol biosynthesis deacetylase BshB1 [Gemmatimonadota bacterium]
MNRTLAPLDLLAVMAHPDDAELLCGGALIKSVRRGRRVGVLDLTTGEMGSSGSGALRAEEAAAAARTMGLTERRCAGLPDSAITNDVESRHVVAEHLRALRPRVVVTHWKIGRHRDHRIAAELVRDACYLSGLKKLDAAGEPFRPHKLVYATSFREDADPPDFVVDVSDEMDAKIEALAHYASQFDGAVQAGEVFPGGDRPLLDQVRAKAAHYGSLIRVRYGEAFRVDEALEVDDLTALKVSTF